MIIEAVRKVTEKVPELLTFPIVLCILLVSQVNTDTPQLIAGTLLLNAVIRSIVQEK